MQPHMSRLNLLFPKLVALHASGKLFHPRVSSEVPLVQPSNLTAEKTKFNTVLNPPKL